MHAQFKMDFSYMGPLYNSWEFGVALKNYMGEEKFNDFLKSGLAMFVGVQNLTKELADELIERIEVYDSGRVEIKWKIKDVME